MTQLVHVYFTVFKYFCPLRVYVGTSILYRCFEQMELVPSHAQQKVLQNRYINLYK